jgi:hypothetical protein
VPQPIVSITGKYTGREQEAAISSVPATKVRGSVASALGHGEDFDGVVGEWLIDNQIVFDGPRTAQADR